MAGIKRDLSNTISMLSSDNGERYEQQYLLSFHTRSFALHIGPAIAHISIQKAAKPTINTLFRLVFSPNGLK